MVNRQYRVVVVDDQRYVQRSLKRVFESTPDLTLVSDADDLEQGLRRCSELDPDVVVVDLKLGDRLDGLKLIERVRAPCRVIIASSAEGRALKKARALGADATHNRVSHDEDGLVFTIRKALNEMFGWMEQPGYRNIAQGRINELTYKEIAEKEDLELGVVKRRISAVYKALKLSGTSKDKIRQLTELSLKHSFRG